MPSSGVPPDHMLMYVVHHVFLPPKLPQGDDHEPANEAFLLDMVIESLENFREHVDSANRVVVDLITSAMQNAWTIRDDISLENNLNEHRLREVLERMTNGGTVPIHIRAQNAGILISNVDADIIIELFELSPSNKAAMTTKGRLERFFPGPAWSMRKEAFEQDGMKDVIANILTKMCHQSAMGTKPKVTKAGQMHDEDRDTVHPKLVTELFGSLLRCAGDQAEVLRISKNTREEVLWSDSLLPWRRSPLWLLIRVTLQLLFKRHGSSVLPTSDLYKAFMAFFMGRILELSFELSSDLIHVMGCKISRRVLKDNMNSSIPGYQYVSKTVRKSISLVNERWSKLRLETLTDFDTSALSTITVGSEVEHKIPRLDQYIASISTWKHATQSVNFQPINNIVRYEINKLPVLSVSSGDSVAYELFSIEAWVASDLRTWLITHKEDPNTCDQLRSLMCDYHKGAEKRYSDDPEAISNILLTTLELWVACDESALSHCPLLADYDPGLPIALLHCLVLPSKSQMERLLGLEQYLINRHRNAKFKDGSIFRDFGSPSSFSVRFFKQSAMHHDLLERIELKATEEKNSKIREFEQKKAQYEALMRSHDAAECKYTGISGSIRGKSHRRMCLKCQYKSKADNISIKIHEWPLPQHKLDAWSTVFELEVPTYFGHWRDASIYIICEVFRSRYELDLHPTSHHSLRSFEGLRGHFRGFGMSQRINLLSEAKPHAVTHRHNKKISVSTVEDVCLNNGLRYRYYDEKLSVFVDRLVDTDTVPNVCTYKMPPGSGLQRFVDRSPIEPNGIPPNAVIAEQSRCPDHLSLAEFNQLASMSLGYHLIWINILRELTMPSVDIKKEETRIMVLQGLHQAGPSNEQSPLREVHQIIHNVEFAIVLLLQLNNTLELIKGSWESSLALSTLVTIALRLLTLTSEQRIQDRCLTFLARARVVALDWNESLRRKVDDSIDDFERTQLLCKTVEIALICVDTFNTDMPHVQTVLKDNSNATIFIQCCIIIREGHHSLSASLSGMARRLIRRWESFSQSSYQIFTAAIRAKKGSFMDGALANSWAAYKPCGQWRPMSDKLDYWLIRHVTATTNHSSSIIQYNLITGELLVDGLRLGRLPPNYERHEMYQQIFGRTILEVMPSLHHDTTFAAKRLYADHVLYFGYDSFDEQLRLHAYKDSRRFTLVPRDRLHGHFPTDFVDSYVHWYDVRDNCIEFRPLQDLWSSGKNLWRLTCHGEYWQLKKGENVLMNFQSQNAQSFARCLAPLDQHDRIHISHNTSSSIIEVDVPRLQLQFYLEPGQGLIRSRQLRDMAIDESQKIDTLVGFDNKLVLKHVVNDSRAIIVPQGDVTYVKRGDHVRVTIVADSVTKFHVFRVDDLLGRLVDSGSLQSKLFLAFLHALTSFCKHDPLLNRTGTEQAISILGSAAVLSHDRLSDEDIEMLKNIAKLTPQRDYYPRDQRVMQQVRWNHNISFLSQHGRLFQCVKNILLSVDRSNIFYPGSKSTIQQLDEPDLNLLQRDAIRSAYLWVMGSGLEDFTHDLDQQYAPRDTAQDSPAASRAFTVFSSIYHGRTDFCDQSSAQMERILWRSLLAQDKVFGPEPLVTPPPLQYDAMWLSEWATHLGKYWCYLDLLFSQSTTTSHRRLHLMMWFSTVAFAPDSDMYLIRLLVLPLIRRRPNSIKAPHVRQFSLALGTSFEASKVQNAGRTAVLPLHLCPEASLTRNQHETNRMFANRQKTELERNQGYAVVNFVTAMQSQWPSPSPKIPTDATMENYLDIDKATTATESLFRDWLNNIQLQQYVHHRIQAIFVQDVGFPIAKHLRWPSVQRSIPDHCSNVTIQDVFSSAIVPTSLSSSPPQLDLVKFQSAEEPDKGRLLALLQQLEVASSTQYESDYIGDLQNSLYQLQRRELKKSSLLPSSVSFREYYQLCRHRVDDIYEAIRRSWDRSDDERALVAISGQIPSLSPVLLLEQLTRGSWAQLPARWKPIIVEYAVALTKLQQAHRLIYIQNDALELEKELSNPGHENWDPMEHPESLLIEVESGILIRSVQEQIAGHMRTKERRRNAVMQLNMGEGKSSLIVPIIAAGLADGSRLVRIVVARPQSKQMFHMITSKLSGLLARRIYRMPFSRELCLSKTETKLVQEMCRECMATGGVLLAQPEHILSFKLMAPERIVSGDTKAGKALLKVQKTFEEFTRDIIDESDENFSPKFELIYPLGLQQPIEMSPMRWVVIQQVLDIVRYIAPMIKAQLPQSIEFCPGGPGSFSRIRILRGDAWRSMCNRTVQSICDTGLEGFPIARQTKDIKGAVFQYITEENLLPDDLAAVENPQKCSIWASSFRSTLLLLRGLFAGGILRFTLSSKRWRVNYGLASNRTPPTQLAVPYRAKDNPTPRSEFSHPDVVIILTLLSHYYGGLQNDDLFTATSHLLRSDQPTLEYQEWIRELPALPLSLRNLGGINLRDRKQCIGELFPSLRQCKKVIDYFLAKIVFTKQMRTFPQKLSASGWDIGQIKAHPTTGFSGTIDSRGLLPLSIDYLDLPEQKHTDALVLEYLLRPENDVALIPLLVDSMSTEAEQFLSLVVKSIPSQRVILDVGARILELDNLEVAQRWLSMEPDRAHIQAAVFFDEYDELCVVDRNGRIDPLQTSTFIDHLDRCLIFLDEAHTRGTDLKLPQNYRAAVTLGPGVTKDRLIQACMRMRKLGQGQSVVFYVPQEIESDMTEHKLTIDLMGVLHWAIRETCKDMRRSIPVWAVQGTRFTKHNPHWQSLGHPSTSLSVRQQVEHLLEPESQTLEERYRPSMIAKFEAFADEDPDLHHSLAKIQQRCREFDCLSSGIASLQEEQERELSPENEQEREVQRPASAKPAMHSLHPDLKFFVSTGVLFDSDAWQPAFETLKGTSAANVLDVTQFPGRLLATRDFARTVQTDSISDVTDDYQRAVQWILTSALSEKDDYVVKSLLIISPFEAQELFSQIRTSSTVTLHIYASRLSLEFSPLDELDLWTMGAKFDRRRLCPHLKTMLNLFAGQLYIQTHLEYTMVCDTLGLAWKKADGQRVNADGFILPETEDIKYGAFKESPVPFMKILMTKIRRKCETINKTHLGKILDGRLLIESDFE